MPNGGNVTISANGTNIPRCVNVAVSTSTGAATCSSAYLPADQHELVADTGATVPSSRPSRTSTPRSSTPPGTGWPPPMAMSTAWAQPRLSGGSAPRAAPSRSWASPAPRIAKGYWVVTANGGVSAFGDAQFYGDLPDLGKHVTDIVAIAGTADGQGYYLVGADGGFFTFGDAKFYGSLPGIHLHTKHVVGMVASPDGKGYLLVGSDGARSPSAASSSTGRCPASTSTSPISGAALLSSTASGYTLVGSDGGAFIFGTGVKFYGSVPGQGIHVDNIVGLASPPTTAAIGWPVRMAVCTASVMPRCSRYRMAYRATCPWPPSLVHDAKRACAVPSAADRCRPVDEKTVPGHGSDHPGPAHQRKCL